uniref:Uncharacterized protein n=1 Tax=Calcidiscus leptoporus TaxID=127549 RepID=A0A7S0J5T0_9EUKA|mmetsp:Transcript_39518/g.92375  ORF Transcript_39518/g.92375 Transcript_39518/m.92375 type:complete len:113 (+) Transcript_39518:2-340(+)
MVSRTLQDQREQISMLQQRENVLQQEVTRLHAYHLQLLETVGSFQLFPSNVARSSLPVVAATPLPPDFVSHACLFSANEFNSLSSPELASMSPFSSSELADILRNEMPDLNE